MGIKKKIDSFDPVFLAIATNIPVLLMTGFVDQGHIYDSINLDISPLLSDISFFYKKKKKKKSDAASKPLDVSKRLLLCKPVR